MNDASNFCQPQSNQEEYCLNDIVEASRLDGERSGETDVASLSDESRPISAKENSRAQGASDGPGSAQPADRRRRRRALISAPVRVRGINVTDAVVDEVSTTIDVSRSGILFVSSSPNYSQGMEVAVIFPYSSAPTDLHAEQPGRVVRSFGMEDGRYSVAIALGEGIGEDIVDSCGRKIVNAPARLPERGEASTKRPLVLVVDAVEMVRDSLKAYLATEGYEVMAVGDCLDAREVLNMLTPALVIAEVEGEGLPGYDLCAHVKATPRLKHIPVVLTTNSGYPSDYANAHSLGAIVCMTKPYKQERLGHVVRLLAPPPPEFRSQKANAPRPADPSRRCGYGIGAQTRSSSNGARRFRFPSFR